MPKLTIALFWWVGWRPLYHLQHVNAAARMLRDRIKIPLRIVLFTDQEAKGAEVDKVLPIPQDPKNVSFPKGINCYRRLRLFDPFFSAQFGTEWVMSVDLDTLILEDITPEIEWAMNDFGFCIIRGRLAVEHGQRPYNGSLYVLRVGQHQHVWDEFSYETSPAECLRSGWRGSDQTWLSLKLQGAPTLGPEHGFYFYEQYLESSDKDPEAKMLHYAGLLKPWGRMCKDRTPELYAEYQRYLSPIGHS